MDVAVELTGMYLRVPQIISNCTTSLQFDSLSIRKLTYFWISPAVNSRNRQIMVVLHFIGSLIYRFLHSIYATVR